MRIALISDTHIPDHAEVLPGQLRRIFSTVDLILHAGDIYVKSVLDDLETMAPVLAARGDDDPSSMLEDKRVKERQVITVDGITIWVRHIFPSSELQYYQPPPDIVVRGHSHEAEVERKQGTLLVNPGSPTFPHYKCELGTVGLLEILLGKIEVNIVQLK